MNILNLKQKIKTPIVVVGLGKSGLAAERFLLIAGFTKAELFTFDEKTEFAIKIMGPNSKFTAWDVGGLSWRSSSVRKDSKSQGSWVGK
jgi:hypothetical protein